MDSRLGGPHNPMPRKQLILSGGKCDPPIIFTSCSIARAKSISPFWSPPPPPESNVLTNNNKATLKLGHIGN